MIGSRISANLVRLRQLGGVLYFDDLAVERLDLVDHGGRRRDQRQIVLALEPLLDDVHVEQTEEPAADAEAERAADFGFEGERRIVERELLQRLAELLVVFRLRRGNSPANTRG